LSANFNWAAFYLGTGIAPFWLAFSNMRAYYYDNTDLDQRELHDSGKTVSLEELEKVGVLYWKFVGDNAQEQLDKMAVERKYKNRDQVRHYERTCWTIHT
jgi:hypothetical protein